jgi:hypothetical protein
VAGGDGVRIRGAGCSRLQLCDLVPTEIMRGKNLEHNKTKGKRRTWMPMKAVVC